MSIAHRRPKTRHARPVPAPVDPPVDLMDAEAVYRNLLLGPDGTWAWFKLGTVRWGYLTPVERTANVLNPATVRWCDLAGHRVHLRMTSHFGSWQAWAEKLYDSRPNHLTPADPDAETYEDYLVASQERIAEQGADKPAVYLGVRLATTRVDPAELHELLGMRELKGDLRRLRETYRGVARNMRREGFLARPVTGRELDWLMHRSLAPGVPVDESTLIDARGENGAHEPLPASVTGSVRTLTDPYASTVTVHALREGRRYTAKVAALTVQHIARRDPLSPAVPPWLSYMLRLPMGTECSAHLDVIPGRDAARAATAARRRNEHVREHHEDDHGERPPKDVADGIEDAYRIENETHSKDPLVAVRVAGPISVAVWGVDDDEVAVNVNELTSAYGEDADVRLSHDFGQWARLRTFVPGNRVVMTDDPRIMPAYFLAAGVPNASTTVGEDGGYYLGPVVGGGTGVSFHDPHHGPRNNKSGLIVCAADLGAGKSVLGGWVGEQSAFSGHRTVMFDPSGPWARIAELPHLRKDARVIELSGARAGALNPYTLVPDPQRTMFDSDRDHQDAVKEADAERRDYMIDTALLLLPPQLVARDGGAMAAVEAAVNTAGGGYGTNPWRVIEALEKDSEYARSLAKLLSSSATAKGSALVWPAGRHAADAKGISDSEATLTVITMKGLTTPPAGVDRAYWMRSERMALPVMHLASRGLAMRVMYADREPKTIITDETGIVTAGQSSWAGFQLRASRDSRKHHAAVYMLGQNPGDARSIGPEMGNLIGCAFIGRMGDEDAARAALPYLRIAEGHGYERIVTRLQTGEWLRRDWDGQVEKVVHDLGHRPHVLAALHNTPEEQATKRALADTKFAEEISFARRNRRAAAA